MATAGALAAGALVAEHAALWGKRWRLSRPAAYALGTATLGTAFVGWAVQQGEYKAAVAWCVIAGMGGAVVTTAYYVRGRVALSDTAAFDTGYQVGYAEGTRRGREERR
jgi:hypothetical protein